MEYTILHSHIDPENPDSEYAENVVVKKVLDLLILECNEMPEREVCGIAVGLEYAANRIKQQLLNSPPSKWDKPCKLVLKDVDAPEEEEQDQPAEEPVGGGK